MKTKKHCTATGAFRYDHPFNTIPLKDWVQAVPGLVFHPEGVVLCPRFMDNVRSGSTWTMSEAVKSEVLEQTYTCCHSRTLRVGEVLPSTSHMSVDCLNPIFERYCIEGVIISERPGRGTMLLCFHDDDYLRQSLCKVCFQLLVLVFFITLRGYKT